MKCVHIGKMYNSVSQNFPNDQTGFLKACMGIKHSLKEQNRSVVFNVARVQNICWHGFECHNTINL